MTMNAIICELCGSNDIKKQDGVFICQHCGTKYSVEEARKLINTVRIDNSNKVENLFLLARRAKENDNASDAEKYYDLIRQETPQDWESNFFAVYYKACQCKIAEIASAADSIKNTIHSTFDLIESNLSAPEEKLNAINQVCAYSHSISKQLSSAAENYYNKIDKSIQHDFYSENINNLSRANGIRIKLCDELCERYGNDEKVFLEAALPYVKDAIEDFPACRKNISILQRFEPDYHFDDSAEKELDRQFQELKDEFEKTINNLEKKQNNGCYVATAVYGSYDCPEVWTLRRFRDYRLSKTLIGRWFIRTYYAISPTLVKKYGDKQWFVMLWKPKLDNLVKRLNNQGLANTPYQDKQ